MSINSIRSVNAVFVMLLIIDEYIARSGVPVPVHVDEAHIEGDHAPDFIKATVGLVIILDHLAMGAIAEGSIS